MIVEERLALEQSLESCGPRAISCQVQVGREKVFHWK